jgi:hypothetical protein
MILIYLINKMNTITMKEITTTNDVGFEISEWEWDMMMAPDDGSFLELFCSEEESEGTLSPSPSVDEEPDPSTHSKQDYDYDSSSSPLNFPDPVFSTNIEVFAISAAATLYRQDAIKRWRAKRSRRCFRKKIVCKARKEYADTRQRRGGRFTKSTAPEWVSITQVNDAV